jgi:hypothetical protein
LETKVMMRIRRATSFVVALLSLGELAAAPLDPIAVGWMRDVRVLAADEMEGRLPGTVGEERATSYIVREFARLGLVPGGELRDGRRTWFQEVPVVETQPPVVKRMSIDGPGGPGALGPTSGLIVTAGQVSHPRAAIAGAPLVFVGYGIDAPDLGWDDYKGADLSGKVAVMLFGEPVAPDGQRLLPEATRGRYANPRLKLQAAAKHGAIATLIILEPKVLGYQWETMANALGQARLTLADPSAKAQTAQASGWVREDLFGRLAAVAGTDLAGLKARAGDKGFRPVALAQLTLGVDLESSQRQITTRSVFGFLPGRTHPEETLIIGAHWDHQGTAPPSVSGDRIYNGAIDNATGVATVLAIARDMVKAGQAERSLMFVAWTMEEPGILGSEFYVGHPVRPLETTVAVVNFDTMFPLGLARDFSQNTHSTNSLTGLLREAGARQGRTLTLEPHSDMFVRMRSDHAPFIRAGVPSIFYMAGEDLLEGGPEKGRAAVKQYFMERYHRGSDEFSSDWDASAISQDISLLSDFARRLANSRQWPEWEEGAEFKVVRDRSAAARP